MKQCDGDINPQTYGGAFFDVEDGILRVLVVDPVLEHLSVAEARSDRPDGPAFWFKLWEGDVDEAREEAARLLADPGFLSWCGLEDYDEYGWGRNGAVCITPDFGQSPEILASVLASDHGYGALEWEHGEATGEALASEYGLPDLDGWMEADEEYDETLRRGW